MITRHLINVPRLEMCERLSTSWRRVQGWVQGFRRGSIMRIFKGANLAWTRSLASFHLRACTRSSGVLSWKDTAQHVEIAERRKMRDIKALFITPIMNQWLRNWLPVCVNENFLASENQRRDLDITFLDFTF